MGETELWLPASRDIMRFRDLLSSAEICDYNEDDLLVTCTTWASQMESDPEQFLPDFYDRLSRFEGWSPEDVDIVTSACLYMYGVIVKLFVRFDLYNNQGVCDYCYQGLRANDLVMRRRPMDYDENKNSQRAVLQQIAQEMRVLHGRHIGDKNAI